MAENTQAARRKGWLKTRSKSSVAVNMAHNYYDPRWGNQTIMLDTLAPDGGTVASIIPIPGEWDLVISKPPSDVEWKLIFSSGSTSLTRVLRDGKEMALCGYCRDCKWWGHSTGRVRDEPWGRCQLADQPGAPIEAEGAAGEWYDPSPSVHTKATFGCVQWEGKNG